MRVRNFLFLLLLLVAGAVLFQGCTKSADSTGSDPVETNPDFSKLIPSCFVANANPIFKRNELLSGSTWNDPHVIKVGSQYVMYASSDNNFDQNVQIYRLVSNDGHSWTRSPSAPVFSKAAGMADWDRKAVETPAVVLFNGTYYLFYTGYSTQGDSSTYGVGYATSSDGISWTRSATHWMGTDPSGPPNLDFNQYFVAEPAPVVFNNKIYLYFTSMGADLGLGTTLQSIGLVTSSDGVTWDTPQQVLTPDQLQYPRASGWIGYSTPHAAMLNGQVHLFVDVANETPSWKQIKLHHALSANGISSWTQDSTFIFERSEFAWTSEEIRSPAVYLEGNKLHMWFAGHNSYGVGDPLFIMGIGYSLCQL